jgi:hypothetical protein
MSNQKILLEFNEKAFKELVQNQEKAKAALQSLVEYCEETLQIKIEDLKAFYQNPKQYCIDQYWKKYGLQYGNAPIQKEKAIEMTAWNNSAFESHYKAAKVAFNFLAPHQYEIGKSEVTFTADEEDFKKYVREEDVPIYEKLSEFIQLAKEIQEIGGKPAWTLANMHPGLASPAGQDLVHSKHYFTSSPKIRDINPYSLT